MTRSQMFMDDEMLGALRALAARRKTTVSQLVREAVRRFMASEGRPGSEILQATAGLWADRRDVPPTDRYVRELRAGGRRRKALGLG